MAIQLCFAQGVEVVRGSRNKKKQTEEYIDVHFHNKRKIDNSQYFTWQKTLYLELDLKKKKNITLQQKHQLLGTYQNLFSLIFNLVSKGQLTIYEYLGGSEQLDLKHQLNFSELLNRFHIEDQNVNIKSYYIKELNYFDQARGQMGRDIVALCPILLDYNGHQELRKPLFWLKFDDLLPFLTQDIVSLNRDNEAIRGTLSDFFTLSMYEGKIVRTGTLENTQGEESTKYEDFEKERRTITSSLSLPDSIIHARNKRSKHKNRKTSKHQSTLHHPNSTSSKRSARDLS